MVKGSQISPKPGAWRQGQIRLSVFRSLTEPLDGEQMYKDFFGFSPAEETKRKAELFTQYSTTTNGVQYELILAGNKIDVVVTKAIEANLEIPKEIPTFENHKEICDQFYQSGERFIQSLTSVSRLAVGAIMILPAGSHKEAYESMGSFLPSVDVDPEGSSDFLYRINRLREIVVEKQVLPINRLSTWSALRMMFQTIAPQIAPMPIVAGTDLFAVKLETDVNTAASTDLSVFQPDQLQKILSVLFEQTTEIADKGDVP